ncbi:MAG: hypothetical protein MJ169_07065 [Treponema sp.]|nr:hypothetical protein [Treponema sp.]
MSRKVLICTVTVFLVVALAVAGLVAFIQPKELDLTYDTDYYYTVDSKPFGQWKYEKLLAGYSYYLYLPPEARGNENDESLKIPLIVTFHGSCSKGSNYSRYGTMFINSKIQNIRHCAVLVLNARGEYYYNLEDTALVIENLLMRNLCLDKTNVIGFGHSQGAYFVSRLSFYKPELFCAVISGSGYYQPTFLELLKCRHVNYWWGNSQNDLGIYEQGHPTGLKIRRWCKNSFYAEYESRGHFWVELNDVCPGTDVTFLDWFKSVVNRRN